MKKADFQALDLKYGDKVRILYRAGWKRHNDHEFVDKVLYVIKDGYNPHIEFQDGKRISGRVIIALTKI